ncbi:hypothetical protein OG394_13095 [Kribbella sp. NBC_01245]|uniref:hypothetical protein n=1 Tax=Kribbella sp. NBC_01245 TaxID=2903578 RepID=UPI002E2D8092|nr:hypothetical protein [Kribbella sp. NBC_01245]
MTRLLSKPVVYILPSLAGITLTMAACTDESRSRTPAPTVTVTSANTPGSTTPGSPEPTPQTKLPTSKPSASSDTACEAVDRAALDACRDYLERAVPARARYYENLRNPDAAVAQAAYQTFTNWYTGQARSQTINGVAEWVGDLSGKLKVSHQVHVTGGQGAASAAAAELRTVETWKAALADGSIQRTIEEKQTHTITLVRFNRWAVSRID